MPAQARRARRGTLGPHRLGARKEDRVARTGWARARRGSLGPHRLGARTQRIAGPAQDGRAAGLDLHRHPRHVSFPYVLKQPSVFDGKSFIT